MMPRGTRLVVKLGLERHMWSYLGYVLCMGAGPEPSARPLREEEELGRALVVSRNNLCVDCCGAPKSTCPERELRDAVRRRPPSLKVREGTLAGSEGGGKENERHKKSNPHMQTKRRRASSPFRATGKGKSCVRPISLRDTWNRRGAGEPILSMALAIRPQWGGPSLADHAAGKCET